MNIRSPLEIRFAHLRRYEELLPSGTQYHFAKLVEDLEAEVTNTVHNYYAAQNDWNVAEREIFEKTNDD